MKGASYNCTSARFITHDQVELRCKTQKGHALTELLLAVTDASAIGALWPTLVKYQGALYVREMQVVMDRYEASQYYGMRKYVRTDDATYPDNESMLDLED